ncbi:MAG: RNA repair domain-containing protein [Sulfolobales archaeon]
MKVNTIRNELNRAYWQSSSERRKYSVLVVDRLSESGFKEYSLVDDVKILNDRLVVGNTVIPFHRVIAILRDGEVIWRRDALQKK